MQYAQRQKGLSLIELMIALVISLVLVGGVSTVYISSKRNYQARDQLSMMDESARVALNALTKHLEHAGYATPAKLPLGNYLYALGDTAPPKASCGGTDTGVHKDLNLVTFASRAAQDDYKPDGTTVTGDAISIRFLGDPLLFTDCSNSGLPASCQVGNAPSMEAALIYNTFFVDQNNGQPSLMCFGSRKDSVTQIVPGIENIQFLYGVDTNTDAAVDQYMTATEVAAAGVWQQVISIKAGILVRSLEPVSPSNEARNYNVLGVALTRNDRYQRAVYTAVIQLRNVVDG